MSISGVKHSKDYDTRDCSDRHPTDAQLREHGFKIHSRPKRGEPVWERAGRLYTQSEAEKILTQKD